MEQVHIKRSEVGQQLDSRVKATLLTEKKGSTLNIDLNVNRKPQEWSKSI